MPTTRPALPSSPWEGQPGLSQQKPLKVSVNLERALSLSNEADSFV